MLRASPKWQMGVPAKSTCLITSLGTTDVGNWALSYCNLLFGVSSLVHFLWWGLYGGRTLYKRQHNLGLQGCNHKLDWAVLPIPCLNPTPCSGWAGFQL